MCGEEAAAGLEVLRYVNKDQEAGLFVWLVGFYFMTWLSPGACGPSAELRAGCNGLMAEGLHH